MSTRSIFGQDLSDHELEIIIDNTAVRAWFAQQTGRQAVLEKWQRDGSLRGRLINLVKAGTKALGIAGTIGTALSSNRVRQREEGMSFANKHGTTQIS